MKRFAAVLLLLLAFTLAVSAQESSAAITGKITDPSGAAISSATITAKDADRATVWTTKTNEEGVYRFARLPIGRYEIKVEASGFQSALRPAFQLLLNQTAKVDIALTLGAVTISPDRKSTRLNSSHVALSRMPSSA